MKRVPIPVSIGRSSCAVEALLVCGLVALVGGAVCEQACAEPTFSTWEQPVPTEQLMKDPTLMPMGKGLVFVPAMTDPLGEPLYSVQQNGDLVGESMTAHCFPVLPGVYEVRLGSGNIEQMIRRVVEVQEGHTTVLLPNWSGLIVDVVDETRSPVKESYELFNQHTQENYGIGKGVDEELGEQLTTWILEPGLYKIVKPGQNINTAANFASVRLLPGELVKYALVVHSESGNFIGFGEVTQRATKLAALRNWTVQSEIGGNVTANTLLKHLLKKAKNIDVGDEDDSYAISGQWRNDLRYSSGRQYAIVRLIAEEGLSKEGGLPVQNLIDDIDFRATYIFRFSERFGPYVRSASSSKAFAERRRFRERQDLIVKLDAAGDTVEVQRNVSQIKLSPPFFPLELKEGIGARLVLFKSFHLNVDYRAGYGARQYYVRDSYELEDNVLKPRQGSTSRGVEMLLGADALISRYLTLTSEFDMLMPRRESDSWEYDLNNRCRIHISKYVSFDIIAELSKKPNVKELRYEEQVLLRFSFLL